MRAGGGRSLGLRLGSKAYAPTEAAVCERDALETLIVKLNKLKPE